MDGDECQRLFVTEEQQQSSVGQWWSGGDEDEDAEVFTGMSSYS